MPLYDYDCMACGRRVEVVHGVHAAGPTHCPNCGSGPLKKAIAAPAVHFKGSGWAKKERRATVAPGASRAAGEAARTQGDGEGGASSPAEPAGRTAGKVPGDDRASVAPATGGSGTATKTD